MVTSELHDRAATGDAAAMHDLGYALEKADPPDLIEASEWYERAAAGGHRCAMNDLGRLAENKSPRDVRAAREWYERAAAAGHVDAYFRLGFLLAELVEPPDRIASLEWYIKAAENGSNTAMYNLGQIYNYSVDPPDFAAARRWYEQAAAAGYTDALFKLAYMLAERVNPPDYRGARQWYEKAAENGSAAAMYNIGQLHRYNLEPHDIATARTWYEKAAASGHADAPFALGVLAEADGDLGGAVIWYEKAAAAGQAGAMNNLGTLFQSKLATPNLPAAIEWYERAAVAGDPNARSNLARIPGTAAATAEPRPELVRTVLPERIARAVSPEAPAGASATSVGVAAVLEAFVDDAAYGRNPFRLAGLRTDADSRKLRNRVTEIEAAERLGAPLARTGVLPVTPLPDPADVKSALNRLREPVNRLVQELFWFWPADGADPAMDLLAQGDSVGAERIWVAQADGDGIAAHNLAVLRHVQALETSRGRAPETWLDALTAWDAALGDAALWQRLRARAARIDDRRLGELVLAELRQAVPVALLRIHTELIVRAADDNSSAIADVHLEVLDQFATQTARYPSIFGAAVIGDARDAAVRKLAARLKSITDEAFDTGVKRPGEANATAHRMLDRARVPLQVIDRLRPPPDPVGAGAHDDLVQTAISCDIKYFNETKDAAASEALLERLGPVATTTATRSRMAAEWGSTAMSRIAELISIARRALEVNEGSGAQTARDLLDRTRLPLARVRAVHGPDGEQTAKWQDAVARTATSCTVAYFNKSSDLDTAEQLLTRIRLLPRGRDATEFVQEQYAALGRIRQQRTAAAQLENNCWYCKTRPKAADGHIRVGLHRDVQHTVNGKKWRALHIDVPRCAVCKEEHRPAEQQRTTTGAICALSWLVAFFGLLIGLGAHPVLIVGGIALVVAVISSIMLGSMDKGVREHTMRFPHITDLIEQGWKKGERPA
ncbi:tetratricopeptide repeat protein [Nocardia sp. NPDC006630]|uniref:tetratricopeptide repeat protein n=1 Tax=Nocardia sp. NPDC006630 TaxID=3157181 RepID=UPI0033BBC7E4